MKVNHGHDFKLILQFFTIVSRSILFFVLLFLLRSLCSNQCFSSKCWYSSSVNIPVRSFHSDGRQFIGLKLDNIFFLSFLQPQQGPLRYHPHRYLILQVKFSFLENLSILNFCRFFNPKSWNLHYIWLATQKCLSFFCFEYLHFCLPIHFSNNLF